MLVTRKLGKLSLFFMAPRLGEDLILTMDYAAEPIRVWSLMASILQTLSLWPSIQSTVLHSFAVADALRKYISDPNIIVDEKSINT